MLNLTSAPYALGDIKAEALDFIAASVVIADTKGHFIYVNQKAVQTLGYNHPTELLGRHWSTVHANDDVDGALSVIRPILQSTGVWQGNVSITRRNKTTFLAQLSLTRQSTGHVCCLFYDVTNEVERERKLADLSLAVENATDGIALLGPDEKYYYLNQKHITHFGYKAEGELLGKTWRVIYPQHEIDRIEQDLFPQLMANGRWQGETQGLTKNGEIIHQEITLTTLNNGGMICIMRNITDKKIEENKRQQLALVAANTNNAVIITGAGHYVEWMNDAAQSILNINPRQPDLCVIHLLKANAINPQVLEGFEEQLAAKGKAYLELSIKGHNGRTLWLLGNVDSVSENSIIKNYVYVLVDITTVKEAEEQLKKALEKERNLNELKSRFVSLTSHEFRTPIAGIQSSLEIMEHHIQANPAPINSKLQKHLNQINEEVDRMTELMNNVLVIGKINQGMVEFTPETGCVNSFVQTLLHNHTGPKPHPIGLQVTGQVRPACFDKRLLHHMLDNLLTNALKYSAQANTPPHINIHYNASSIEFTFTDYGIGIPVEDQPHLFQSFFRASNTQNVPGTGLGLPIVQQFAELHGGKVVLVKSQPGKTIFKLTISA